jgi:hypothetical protein
MGDGSLADALGLKGTRPPLTDEERVRDEQWRRGMGLRVATAAQSLVEIFDNGFSLGADWDVGAQFFHDELKVQVVYVPEQRHIAVQVFKTTNVDDRRPLSERAWSPLIQWLIPQEWVAMLAPPRMNELPRPEDLAPRDRADTVQARVLDGRCLNCGADGDEPHHPQCPRSRQVWT